MNTVAPLARLLDACADAVQAVRAGHTPETILQRLDAGLRPGAQALAFQVLRRLGSAAELRRLLVPKPPPPHIDAVLCSALALLWPDGDASYAEHTLVDQAVTAARSRSPRAAGLVNAVLRRFLRERDALVAAARRSPRARWNHPEWWIERLHHDWPAQWQALLGAADRHPPMTLRVNRRRLTGEAYRLRLAASGRGAALLADPAFGGQALVLDQPCQVQALPGFAAGEVSVQDASAQRAALLLLRSATLRPGARVLDACAAPGGKTAHLLELADLDLLALDNNADRLGRAQQTLQRLGLKANTRIADAAQPETWWDGRAFDAILLDAPCTASGIVRRHPDIRWLRRETDVPALAAQQARLLDALWPLLASGGVLLYATCSIFRAEGQDTIDAFLQRQAVAGAVLDAASPGHLLSLPDNSAHAGPDEVLHDGFFYALIRKTATAQPK